MAEVHRLKNIMDNNIAAEINAFQRKTGLVVLSLDLEKVRHTIGDAANNLPVLLTSTITL
jgi:hypothetical protein